MRRRCIPWVALAAFLTLTAPVYAQPARGERAPRSEAAYDLRDHRTPEDLTEIKLTFSAKGTLGNPEEAKPAPDKSDSDKSDSEKSASEKSTDAGETAKPQSAGTVPMSAASRLQYEERTLEVGQRSARVYRHCDAKLAVGEHQLTRTLRPQHRVVLCQVVKEGARIEGLTGALTREELDVLETHANSMLIYGLLPTAAATRVGDRWTPDRQLLAALLNLDGADSADVFAQLVEVTNGLAHIRFAGSVAGYCDGSSTEIRLQGDLRYDLNWRRISWCQLSLHEVREPGGTSPGFDVAAELRMLLQPCPLPAELTDARLQPQLTALPATAALIEMDGSRLGMRWYHDRAWYVTGEMPSGYVMRYVLDGDIVAQCHVSQLPQLAAGKHLGLEDFQSELRQALGERFGQFLHASQYERPDRCRVLRVDVGGNVSGVPIRWVYYNLQHPGGQRAALVFTMKDENSELFGQADEQLAAHFEFVPSTGTRTADGGAGGASPK